MKYRLADDVKPQLKLLLIATLVSVGIWIASWYFPFAAYIVYPLQLFATFVHEGGHVLATLMTGGSVQSLTVSPDASGLVWSLTQEGNWIQAFLVSSAGYVGTTIFGVLLLVWFRYGYSSRNALYFSSGFVGIMTLVFGLLAPIWNVFNGKFSVFDVSFTVLSGAVITGALFAIAKYAELKWVNFSLAFLAIQCLLNAVFSLKTLFVISATTQTHSDAVNMAEATGVPSLFWVTLWIVISIVVISLGLRAYAVTKLKTKNHDLPFED